jgi:exonuclease SbcC
MLPLKLSITGLYSYQKKQTIDFEELTNAGLFGIFGAVGSGKSSVLEAIGFVLYGDTERLNKTDKRSYNMLNLKSDKANIEFEFLNFEERKFKFVADWKRKKRFEETTSIERLAYEWKGEEWIPMTSADATEIIGLTYENFRRTIIIPQGKFKEFLDLKGKERSDMMKEIFHLQRFDVASKVGILQSTTRTQLDQLKGALSGFEAISKETIAALEIEVTAGGTELQKSKAELGLAETELQQLRTLKANFEDLEKKKNLLLTLTEKKLIMEALQAEIDAFERTEKTFKAVFNNLQSAKTSFDQTNKRHLLVAANKKIVEQNRATNQIILNGLQPQFDALENSKNKVTDLESVEKVLGLQMELAVTNEKNKKAEVLFLETEKKEKEFKQESTKLQTELITLKSKRLDGTILIDLGHWYTIRESLKAQWKGTQNKSKIIQESLDTQNAAFHLLELPFKTWKTVLEEKVAALLIENKVTAAIKTKLLVSKELAHFSEQIHDGENCPLCGSLEHPNVMQVEDVSAQLATIEEAILKLAKQEKEILEIGSKAEKLEYSIAHAVEQLRLVLREKETLETEHKVHLAKFIWAEYDPKDSSVFLSKKQEQQLVEKTINETETREKVVRLQQEQVFDQMKIQTTNKGVFANEIASKSAIITNELSKLKAVSFSQYEYITIAAIQDEKTKLHLENNRIASEHKSKSDAMVILNQELAGLEASLKLIGEQVVLNKQLVQDTQKTITELLKIHQFDSVDSVQAILSKIWDVELEKGKTKQFAVDLKVAENSVAESEKLVMNQAFDVNVFEDKKMLVAEGKLKYETQLGKNSTLQDNLKRINEALAEKAELLAQFEVLNTRSTNLGTLANMFNASGFVNYVSSIYLQNLADVANVRFHRMTKNQLSLTINSSNEFEIIDYLNNGASRSVKTLSGGQGFQASLCLALALAESVQSLNKNDKNFFFIDEGFGTQDPESVAVVFETLQSLYKENRIVGIISHVAELQERIPRSINVFKDEEKGSVVSENWN